MERALFTLIARNDEGCDLLWRGRYAEACTSIGLAKIQLKHALNASSPPVSNSTHSLVMPEPNELDQRNSFLPSPHQDYHIFSKPIQLHGVDANLVDPWDQNATNRLLVLLEKAVSYNEGLAHHLNAIDLLEQGRARASLAQAMVSYATAVPCLMDNEEISPLFGHGEIDAGIYNNLAHIYLTVGDISIAASYGEDVLRCVSRLESAGRLNTRQGMVARDHCRRNCAHIGEVAAEAANH
jgi:hypothetical protein